MKKSTLLSFAIVFLSGYGLVAQNLASTVAGNKNAIIEEFTGVNCPNCPAGHTVVAGLLNDNPGRAFVVGYHPTNSSYTTPRNSTDPDFRRPYLDAFYTSSYVGSRFMPGAMINRRSWGAERMVGRGSWVASAQTIMSEASPANVGLKANHNTTTDNLVVDLEVYFTADVTDQLAVYVHLMEDGLVADQSNGGATYVHKHVFREDLTGQWGDNITGTTNTGDLFSTQLTLDMTSVTDPIDLTKSHVIAFIYNTVTGEVITGIEVNALGGTSVGLAENKLDPSVSVYPNPVNDQLIWEFSDGFDGDVNVSLVDILGKEVYKSTINARTRIHSLDLTDRGMSAGIYFLKIEGPKGTLIKKFTKK